MKNWKKLVALLLSAVMVLALFTACSDSSDHDTEAEAAVMSAINEKRGVSASFTNNTTLKNIAWESLGKINAENGKIEWDQAHKTLYDKNTGKITIVNVATNGGISWSDGKVQVNAQAYEQSNLDALLEHCNLFIRKDFSIDFNLNSKWVNVGVAAKRINGKTYVAVAVEVNTKA